MKTLVIACNTRRAACLRDARERYDIPVVEVILPAVRRAVAATRNRPRRRDRHPATISRWPTTTPSPPPRRSSCTSARLPALRRLRRARHHRRPELLGRRARVPRPAAARADVDTLVLGCTHYPLLTGVISIVMGDGSTLVSSAEETAKDVLPGADRAGPAACADRRRSADARASRHRPGRTVPADWPAASSAYRPAPGRSPHEPVRCAESRSCHSSDAVKLTVLGCSGSIPRPGLARFRLPGRGGRPPARPRPRQRRPRRAATPRDPFNLDAVLLSHLHADHCADFSALTVLRRYRPAPPYPPAGAAAGVRPADSPEPVRRPVRAGRRRAAETDFSARLRLPPAGTGETVRIGAARRVTSAVVRTRARRTRFRLEHDGRTLVYSGDTGACPALDRAGLRRRSAARRSVLDRPADPAGWTCTCPAGKRARPRAGPASAG